MSRVLIAGRRHEELLHLRENIAKLGDYDASLQLIVNGDADPLQESDRLPDILVLLLNDQSLVELEALAARPVADRPQIVVIGDELTPETMRAAMQAGARDFLRTDADEQDLSQALRLLATESRDALGDKGRNQIAIINAAGGNGASTIAVNLAYHFASERQYATALVDLDLQFAPLGQYLDLRPARGILEALERVDEMDSMALEGYMNNHDSGIKLVGAVPVSEVRPVDQSDSQIGRLLGLIRQAHEHTIIDVPSRIDPVGVAALEDSDHILIVVQQDLVSLRNAARLIEIMCRDLAVPDYRIALLVNRYNKNAALDLDDIRRTVKDGDLITVPNQFRHVAESIDLGVPILESNQGGAFAKAIAKLAQIMGDIEDPAPRNGLIGKALSQIWRR